MQSLGEAVLTLTINPTRLKAGLTEAEGATTSSMAKMKKAALATSAVLVAGLVVGIDKSVKSATQFQTQMELIQTQAGASDDKVRALSKGILGLSGPVATAPEELSKGMYHLYSQGIHPTAKAMDALKIAAEGAKLGQADLEDVTNALGAVLVSHIKGVHNTSQAMGMLNATVGAGDMRMQQLAEAMGTGLPASAAVAHVSLKDVSAALATFGDNNIRGAKAGTALNSMLRIMSSPSQAAAKALKIIGLNSLDLAHKMSGPGGLVSAFEMLKEHLASHTEQMKKYGLDANSLITRAFGGRQSTGVKILVDQLERLRTKVGAVGDGATSFKKNWEQYTQTLQYKIDSAKASFESFGISMGTILIPYVTKLATALGTAASWLTKHKTLAAILIGVIGGLAAAYLTVTAVIKAWRAATLLAEAATKIWTAAQWLLNAALDANPISIVVIALAALAAALVVAWTHSQTFRNVVKQVWSDVKSAAMSVVNFFKNDVPAAFKDVLNWVRDHWKEIAVLISGPFGPLAALATNAFGIRSHLMNALQDIKGFASRIVGDIAGFFTSLPGKIASAFSSLGSAAVAALKAPINAIISAIDALSIPVGLHIKTWHGIPRGVSIDWGHPFHIPMLAQGGIVNAPTLAMIGEAGPEAVVPLPPGGPGALGGNPITIQVNGVVGNPRDVAVKIGRELERLSARGLTFNFA